MDQTGIYMIYEVNFFLTGEAGWKSSHVGFVVLDGPSPISFNEETQRKITFDANQIYPTHQTSWSCIVSDVSILSSR